MTKKKDAPHLIPATGYKAAKSSAKTKMKNAASPRDKSSDEKLRVFREWAKGEASGKGRARTPAQYDAEAKGQKDLRKKTNK